MQRTPTRLQEVPKFFDLWVPTLFPALHFKFFKTKDYVGAEDAQQSPSNKPHPPGAVGVRDARPACVGRRHEGCPGDGGRGRHTATQSQVSGVFWWVM